MIPPLDDVEKNRESMHQQCPRALLVGIGSAGIAIAQQVARRVGELKSERLMLTKFITCSDPDAPWNTSKHDEVVALQPRPVPALRTRQEAYGRWEGRLTDGCNALHQAALEVMDPEVRASLAQKGWSVSPSIEIYFLGDLVDPICSSALVPLIQMVREKLLPDIPLVLNAMLSVAGLSDPALPDRERTEAMAYAALKELNLTLCEIDAGKKKDYARWGRLDHCFLVDRVLEGDITEAIPKADYTLNLISGFLSGFFLADLRRVEKATFLFRPSWDEDIQIPKGLGVVAGLGYAGIIFPIEPIASYLGHLEARRLIRFGLLMLQSGLPLPPLESEQTVARLDLSPESASNRLRRIANGGEMAMEVDVPDPNQIPCDRLPNQLRQLREEYEQGLLHDLVEQVGANERVERGRVLNETRQSIGDLVRTKPLGWLLAEQLIHDLDLRMERWQGDLPAESPVPDLPGIEYRLRLAVASRHSVPALVPHLFLALLLALSLSLSTSLGWMGALPIAILTIGWIVWSLWGVVWYARRLGKAYVGLLKIYLERHFENELLRAMNRIYRSARESLGYSTMPEGGQARTEMAKLRRWRDTLAGAAAALEVEPAIVPSTLPYGDRPAISQGDFARYYQPLTKWSPLEIAAEFLTRESRLPNPRWNWEDVDSNTLANLTRGFCEDKYREGLNQARLDLVSNVEQTSGNQQETLGVLLRQLRESAEPLIRRARSRYFGNQLGMRFLLIHDLKNIRLSRIMSEEDLVPALGSPEGYLAILQVELGLALSDFLALSNLQRAYKALPDRRIAHSKPEWVRLPDVF